MSNSPLVLVIEDEPQTRRFLRPVLKNRGFRLVEASTGNMGLQEAAARRPEIILLDLGLPDIDGVEVTRKLREWSFVPIIVLSVRDQEDEKIEALDAGADDYLTKPFGVGELLARMRVALRHADQAGLSADARVLEFDGLTLDLEHRRVTRDGSDVHLTPIEYKLLVLLARNAGKVLTHGHILKEVWGPAYVGQTHYVRVRMAELRRKVERDPARPKLLMTEPGIGYRLRVQAPVH